VSRYTRRWFLLSLLALPVCPVEAKKPDRNERPLTPDDIKEAISECHEWAHDPYTPQYHIWRDHICRDCGRTEQILEVMFDDKVFLARWFNYLETKRNRSRIIPFSRMCDDVFGFGR